MVDEQMTERAETTNSDQIDADTAISILTACRQDLDAILEAIPASKRGRRFIRATEALADRIACGEEMREARRDR